MPEVQAEAQRAQVAVEDASALRTAGVRDAAVLSTAGQRQINLMWEKTQMRIALLVVCGVMVGYMVVVAAVVWMILNDKAEPVSLTLLGGALGALSSFGSLVIGFYFSRTNHTKTGGVMAGDVGR